MNTPELYLFAPSNGEIPDGAFSNFSWGQEEAMKRAKASGKSQVVYQLVPVYQIEVKVTHEYLISSTTE